MAREGVIPRLRVVASPDRSRIGCIVLLGGTPVSIGRDHDNGLACTDHAMSRRHAIVTPTARGWELADAGSANGTWCEGLRVTRQLIERGQLIKVGDTVIAFESTAGAAPFPAPIAALATPALPTPRRRPLLWLSAVFIGGVFVLVTVGVGLWVAVRADRAERVRTVGAGNAATAFRRQAARDYRQALGALATPRASAAYDEFDEALWPVTKPRVGWAWFFDTSLVCVGGPAAGGTVVGFYNPWVDVFVLGLWGPERNGEVRLAEAEVVLGDYLRRHGQAPFEAERLWMRRDVYRPAGVGLATAETLLAFETAFRPRGLARYTAGRRPWRATLAGLEDKGRMEANRYAAGLALANAFAELAPLYGSTERVAGSVRACLATAFKTARREGMSALAKGAAETPNESTKALAELPADSLERFKPASFLLGSSRSVLLLADAERPDVFLGILIATDGTASRISRVDVLSFQAYYASGLDVPAVLQ